MKVISAARAEEVWRAILKYILRNGLEFIDRHNRNCVQISNLGVEIEDVKGVEEPAKRLREFNGWVYPTLEEISGTIFSKEAVGNKYLYGERIFSGINQVDKYIIPLLKREPNSRRAIVSLWRVDADTNSEEAPGLVTLQFSLRDGKLNVSAFIRSNDMFIGWPANIYQAHLLQRYVAEKIGVGLGSISTFSGSAHIFKDQIKEIKETLAR